MKEKDLEKLAGNQRKKYYAQSDEDRFKLEEEKSDRSEAETAESGDEGNEGDRPVNYFN